ncbi:MAG: branched-chain amino acid ABC transporter substrate-binding protein [Methanobacteriota archaeon]|nr:MAG: branched-chain amino acid ABC transporter substrate-binding protein [Euryarchaeota archaeon]
MSEPSQAQGTPLVTPRSRRKVIAIGIAFVVILVAVGATAVYYLTLPKPFGGSIKVGFTISLTGQYNIEGTNSRRGIETVANWINSHGGLTIQGKVYNVSLDYYDDQSLPGNVPNLYTRIIQQDNATFLLAPYSSPLTTAAAPAADQYDRVMISHGGSSDLIWTQTSRRNLVAVLSPASLYLKGAVDWLKANHPTDKIAALYAQDSFSTFATQSALGYAQSLGFSVVYNASYPTNAQDLSTQLTAAKNAGADDLIGGGHYTDGLLIMNQLKTTWNTPPPKFISLLVAVTEPAFQTQLGGTANNVTGPSQWETVVTYSPTLAQAAGLPWYGPSPSEFTQLYGTLNGGATPAYHAAEAGAALLVLAIAIEQANSFNTTAVRAKLGSMHVMNFFGEYQIDSRGLQIAHSMVLVQWQAGLKKVVLPPSVADGSCQYPYSGT